MSKGKGRPPMPHKTIPLGKIVPTQRGEYSPQTEYEGLDIVSYNGSSYISKMSTKGAPPTNTQFWTLLAAKGNDGANANDTYIHDQIMASAIWTIHHGLGRFPSISIVDSSGNAVMGNIQYLSGDVIQITFSSEFSGKAYLN